MGIVLPLKSLRICFDIDNTLVKLKYSRGSDPEPIDRVVTLLRRLEACGHTIILYTARKMRTHAGNSGAALADIGLSTFQSLKELRIPFHEIYFGKPFAHVYIDDSAVNPIYNFTREFGFDDLDEADDRNVCDSAILDARDGNEVFAQDDRIVKHASGMSLKGEIFVYRQIPTSLQKYFPQLISASLSEKDGTSELVIERIRGVTFSQLHVNNCVTPHRLCLVLSALKDVHSFASDTGTITCDIYANYVRKVMQRYERFAQLYAQVCFQCSESAEVVERLIAALQIYQHQGRGMPCEFIHGDPVFSNIMLRADNSCCFFDMRGLQGDEYSTSGDAIYDLSKVLQSIKGYDFYLLGAPITDVDKQYLSELENEFIAFVREHYSKVKVSDVYLVAASHFFSLIPFHSSSADDNIVRYFSCFVRCLHQYEEVIVE